MQPLILELVACRSSNQPEDFRPIAAVAYGNATLAGQPLRNARVHGLAFKEGCSGGAFAEGQTFTDETGRYRLRMLGLVTGPRRMCIAVTAYDQSGGAMDSVTISGDSLNFAQVPLGKEDSVRVDLAFP